MFPPCGMSWNIGTNRSNRNNMAKGFMEVFPGLKLEGSVRGLFEKVTVERVTATRQKDLIRVYISCDRLIPKQTVFAMEEEIRKQLFPDCNITVKIQEKFHLSAQYNPRTLLEAYHESILLELKECSPVEYSLFRSAKLSFEEEGKTLRMEVPDTVIAHERSTELARILEKICCERCGVPMGVSLYFVEPKENPRKAEEEIAMARKVAVIAAKAGARPAASDYGLSADQLNSVMSGGYRAEYDAGRAGDADRASALDSMADRAAGAGQSGGMDAGYEAYLAAAAQTAAQEAPFEGGTVIPADAAAAAAAMGGSSKEGASGSGGTSSAERGDKAGSGGKYGKGKFNREGRGDFRRSFKKSDNPDVLYGRDFDEDAIPIEEIIGEMGEVVIRGKIIAMDQREIRNERTILIFMTRSARSLSEDRFSASIPARSETKRRSLFLM